MKRIGILGDIGSGKSFVARSFGYPVFDADEEVAKIASKVSSKPKVRESIINIQR